MRGAGGIEEAAYKGGAASNESFGEKLVNHDKDTIRNKISSNLAMGLDLSTPKLGLRTFSSPANLLSVERSVKNRFETAKSGADTTVPGYKALGGLGGLNLGIWGESSSSQGSGMWENKMGSMAHNGWGNKEATAPSTNPE